MLPGAEAIGVNLRFLLGIPSKTLKDNSARQTQNGAGDLLRALSVACRERRIGRRVAKYPSVCGFGCPKIHGITGAAHLGMVVLSCLTTQILF